MTRQAAADAAGEGSERGPGGGNQDEATAFAEQMRDRARATGQHFKKADVIADADVDGHKGPSSERTKVGAP